MSESKLYNLAMCCIAATGHETIEGDNQAEKEKAFDEWMSGQSEPKYAEQATVGQRIRASNSEFLEITGVEVGVEDVLISCGQQRMTIPRRGLILVRKHEH